jgi:hypothetical protein
MKPELEIEILRFIRQAPDRRLQFIARDFREKNPGCGLTQYNLMAMAWDWISRGLAYFDMSPRASSNWSLQLSERGTRYIDAEEENPYNDTIWYASLVKKSEGLSEIEKQYAQEAIQAFVNELYVSCHVMIGVASEAVVVRMAKAMARSALIEGRESILKAVNNPRLSIRELFNKMRPELDKAKTRIPGNLADNMSIWLDSMFDVIRVNRNEAGHPAGSNVGREESVMVLRCFVTYMSKACRLICHLEQNARQDNAANCLTSANDH